MTGRVRVRWQKVRGLKRWRLLIGPNRRGFGPLSLALILHDNEGFFSFEDRGWIQIRAKTLRTAQRIIARRELRILTSEALRAFRYQHALAAFVAGAP